MREGRGGGGGGGGEGGGDAKNHPCVGCIYPEEWVIIGMVVW